MLHNKDINKIAELKNDFTPEGVDPDFIKSSLKCFSFSELCNCLKPLKIKGYSIVDLLTILISMTFEGVSTVSSMYASYIHSQPQAQKDAFYRLKNNPMINWRLILMLFVNKFLKIIDKNSNNRTNKTPKCLIFDDTLLPKTGLLTECISYVHDHISKRFVPGFKLLLAGYWDGTSLLPADFSIHREQGKNKVKPFGLKKKQLKRQFKKKRPKESSGYGRRQEADTSKVESLIKMLKRVVGQGLAIDYVLMDSWFTCKAVMDAIADVKKQSIHFIGMYSKVHTKFGYKGSYYTYKQLINKLGKAHRCKKLKLQYKQAVVTYEGRKVKLYMSKQGRNGKWRIFISSDISLTFVKMLETYQIRWSVEVLFKETKQLLGLGKSQSSDFDGQIADITLTMIQYLLLTLRYRFAHYETYEGLFASIQGQMQDLRLSERLWDVFIELLHTLVEIVDNLDMDELLNQLFYNEKVIELFYPILNHKNAA